MTARSLSSASHGIVALLDLPANTVLSIDGHSVVLQRDDFVGFDHVPAANDEFHLVTVRPAASRGTNGSSQQEPSLVTGLIIAPSNQESEWILARRYDRQTEELSSIPLDRTTTDNLLLHVRSGRMEQQRVISYNRILPSVEKDSWKWKTNFISRRLLQRRGLDHGDKVLPGSYDDSEAKTDQPSVAMAANPSDASAVDGTSIKYPPIPFIDRGRNGHHTQHVGTKRYLSRLSPTQRTTLFLSPSPSDDVLADVLDRYYGATWQDLIGDLQLSYTIFLHMHCLSSLEHWRDLVAMLSLLRSEQVDQNAGLFVNLLGVLAMQLTTMENEFFEDVEYSENTFFAPALKRLVNTCSNVNNDDVQTTLSSLMRILSNRFPALMDEFVSNGDSPRGDEVNSEADTNKEVECYRETLQQIKHTEDTNMSVESDSDGPVVVPYEEVDESFARNANITSDALGPLEQYPLDIRLRYPLLFASKLSHEDILMACARILDEAVDVSLVREAAAYLEDVEAKMS